MRVQDLPEHSNGVFLYCPVCSAQYSAARGDYFMLPGDRVIRCCSKPMILARKEVHIIEVQEVKDHG